MDRVWKKLNGWKEKFLSHASRKVLIKSVVQALPAYTIQCFLLPKGICKKLVSLVRNFWWHNSAQEKTICWQNWRVLCLSKREGGLGFRDPYNFNLALLAKQCWRLLHFPNSLAARVLQAKYYLSVSFMVARQTPGSSLL